MLEQLKRFFKCLNKIEEIKRIFGKINRLKLKLENNNFKDEIKERIDLTNFFLSTTVKEWKL